MSVDTSDMLAVHQVFRTVLGGAGPLLARVDHSDDDRVGLLVSYFANVLALLHAHHESEDVLLWPPLLERADDAVPVLQVAAQHVDLEPVVADVETRLAAWAAAPTAGRASALARAFGALDRALGRHLDDAERLVLPLAARLLTQQEWDALPAHGMAQFRGDRPWLVLGLVHDAMTPEQVQRHVASMPRPAREFWLSVGRPQYEAFAATLRG